MKSRRVRLFVLIVFRMLVSRLEDQFVPVAYDLSSVSITVLAVPYGESNRRWFADHESHIFRVAWLQFPHEDDAPGTVAPNAFPFYILTRGRLGLEGYKTSRVGILVWRMVRGSI